MLYYIALGRLWQRATSSNGLWEPFADMLQKYVFGCICMYVCMYVCMYLSMYVSMYLYIYIYIYIYICCLLLSYYKLTHFLCRGLSCLSCLFGKHNILYILSCVHRLVYLLPIPERDLTRTRTRTRR